MLIRLGSLVTGFTPPGTRGSVDLFGGNYESHVAERLWVVTERCTRIWIHFLREESQMVRVFQELREHSARLPDAAHPRKARGEPETTHEEAALLTSQSVVHPVSVEEDAPTQLLDCCVDRGLESLIAG